MHNIYYNQSSLTCMSIVSDIYSIISLKELYLNQLGALNLQEFILYTTYEHDCDLYS